MFHDHLYSSSHENAPAIFQDKEESRMSEEIIRPFEEKMVSSALLEIPRNTYSLQ